MTTPALQAQIDELNAALASGVLTVRTKNSQVEYRSVDDLIRARNDLVNRQAAADAAASGTTRHKQTRLYHAGRGY